jgi:hypothetical protein
MDWSFNFAKAAEDRPNERYIEFQNRGLNFNMNLNDERFPLITGTGDNSINDFRLREITDNFDYTDETELGFKLNFRTPLSFIENQKGRLRFGFRMRIKDKQRDNIFYEYDPITAFGNLNTIDNSFFGGENWQVGSQYVAGNFATNTYLGNLDLNNATLFDKSANPAEYLALNYKASENIYASYIRWDQDFNDKLSMIAGLRVEATDIDYTANYVLDEDDLIGEINNTNNYVNLLPSI